MILRARSRKRCPVSVNPIERVVRCNSRAPRRCSRLATWRVTTDGDTRNRRAAAANPLASQTAMKAAMASSRSILLLYQQ